MRNSLNEDEDFGGSWEQTGGEEEEREEERRPGPLRLPEDHPARMSLVLHAWLRSQIPERNTLSRWGVRVTAPDGCCSFRSS